MCFNPDISRRSSSGGILPLNSIGRQRTAAVVQLSGKMPPLLVVPNNCTLAKHPLRFCPTIILRRKEMDEERHEYDCPGIFARGPAASS